MRYAIFSDIHGNLEALRSVLHAARDEGARKLFCAGDIVGYGANPSECIEELQSYNVTSVAGNHDWAVCGKRRLSDFDDLARRAVEWTQARLTDDDLRYLSSLPLTHTEEHFEMVHATLQDPEQFGYIFDILEARDTFFLMQRPVCFIGHTHRPYVFRNDMGKLTPEKMEVVLLKGGARYLINVGSVGQPRDHDPRACYAIYDPDLKWVKIRRVAYDVTLTQKKIFEAGLPEKCGQRLSVGQ